MNNPVTALSKAVVKVLSVLVVMLSAVKSVIAVVVNGRFTTGSLG